MKDMVLGFQDKMLREEHFHIGMPISVISKEMLKNLHSSSQSQTMSELPTVTSVNMEFLDLNMDILLLILIH